MTIFRMLDLKTFLLRTDAQAEEFRRRYQAFISRHYDEYASWIGSLPLCVRTPYLSGVPDKAVPAVIGIICLLYIDGRVNIQFSDDMATVSRQPSSIEEWEAWCYPPPPKKRKTKRPSGSLQKGHR